MGWRDRDWAQFTDSEREAIYGGGDPGMRARPGDYWSSLGRSIIRPGAGIAIALSAVIFALGHFPQGQPLIPAFRFSLPSLSGNPGHHEASGARPGTAHRTFPLNVPPAVVYRSVLRLSGIDPNATSGTVVVTGQWNGGAWGEVASGALAVDHSWSVPITMNQQGTLSLNVSLPSGDSLAGTITVEP
jgi:hypothetical protein